MWDSPTGIRWEICLKCILLGSIPPSRKQHYWIGWKLYTFFFKAPQGTFVHTNVCYPQLQPRVIPLNSCQETSDWNEEARSDLLVSHCNCFANKTRIAVPTKKIHRHFLKKKKKRGWIFRTIYPYHLTWEVKIRRHQDGLPPLVSWMVTFLNPNISGRAGLGRGEGCRCYFACLWRNVQVGMPSRQEDMWVWRYKRLSVLDSIDLGVSRVRVKTWV